MSLLLVGAISAIALIAAYRTFGALLARLLKLDPRASTPAVALRDDMDYAPLAPHSLLSQHFSAIAAAGPIVGPILAGAMFGWLPALLWILLGAIFVGGVHDITALVASVRHQARSIAEVVREHMSRRSYLLFLIFVWLALEYIIVAFTDITASSFVGAMKLESGESVSGPGIATSSLLYLVLPVIMGVLLRYTKLRLGLATLIFLPLVGVAIWIGQDLPLDLAELLSLDDDAAHKVWNLIILGYCFTASLVPMWALLQPRGHLGGYFLFFALAGGCLGILFGGQRVSYPAFTNWTTAGGKCLFPMLFITIACGACSGFHAIVASGTTSKQLRTETDAKLIGYGAMLMEGMVAVVSLSCVMRLTQDSSLVADPDRVKPTFLYAYGIGGFLEVLHVPAKLGVSFALMAFTTFVYDTLDVCTRLGRYILQELTGWRGRFGKIFAAVVTVGAPVPFLLQNNVNAQGKPVPVWQVFWDLFGASNQLLAALTLVGLTVWLWRTREARWVFAVLGIPSVLMYTMSTWALLQIVHQEYLVRGFDAGPVFWAALALVGLAAMMLIEALRILLGVPPGPPTSARPVPLAT